MKSRINRKSMLPKWFELSAYEEIKNLNDHDLILQLVSRRELYTSTIVNEYDGFDDILYNSRGVIWDFDKHHYSYFDNEFGKKYSELQMSAIGGVEPLNLLDTMRYAKNAESYISDESIERSLRGLKRSISKVTDTDNSMVVKLNMDWPDSVIISDLQRLLSIWRAELDIQNDNSLSSQSWDVIKKKIYDYNVFPMIDLLSWAKSSGKTITNGVITVALFEDGRYDYTHITQTIKPFIDNLMKEFYLEKLRREIIGKK